MTEQDVTAKKVVDVGKRGPPVVMTGTSWTQDTQEFY